MAVKTVANTLSDTGDVFSRDNDPELVRDAIPFALKLYESLLDSVPKHEPLLVATCSGFTQYAYAFVQTEADLIRHEKVEEAAAPDAPTALARAEKKDVPLLYWTAAAWGSAVALGPDRPELLIDFPSVRALIERALALDETWSKGAIHEVLITLESLETLGGSREKARQHFARAVELQGGKSPGPYVALATGVSAAAPQDRAEFEKLMSQALAIDPEGDPSTRLVTLISQRRARSLLANAGSIFSQ
jgi:hypothetical protein